MNHTFGSSKEFSSCFCTGSTVLHIAKGLEEGLILGVKYKELQKHFLVEKPAAGNQ